MPYEAYSYLSCYIFFIFLFTLCVPKKYLDGYFAGLIDFGQRIPTLSRYDLIDSASLFNVRLEIHLFYPTRLLLALFGKAKLAEVDSTST